MRKLNPDKREIVEALFKADHLLAAIIEIRLSQGMSVLNVAKRLEKMADTMRNMSLEQELKRP